MALSSQQCGAIQTALQQAILPKCGYNRNTPNAVVFGHLDFGGLEFRSIYVEQGRAQLQALLSILRSTGVAHQLACIALTWAQLIAGTGVSILHDVHTSLPHLDPMIWLPSIRSFLAFTHCHMDVHILSLIPPPQRIHDCHLMDVILSGNFSPSQLHLINCCRLFLGVRLLSDITLLDGTAICSHVAAGRHPPITTHKVLQPYQDNPGPRAWRLWRRALSLFTVRSSLQLRRPLGLWVVSGPALHREWVSYATYYPRRVYLLKQDEYEVYEFTHGLHIVYTGNVVQLLPPSAIPIDLNYAGPEMSAVVFPHPPAPSIPASPPSSFSHFVDSLPEWEQRLLQHCTFSSDGVFGFLHQIQSAFTRNPNIAVVATSDGSAPGFRGTFGWACALRDGTRLAQNFGVSYGFRTSSFRAELYGILSFLRFILREYEYTAASLPPCIQLYMDSKSAVDRLSNLRQWPQLFPNMTLMPEWDVLQAILNACHTFGDSLGIFHVRGHQDRHTAFDSLSLSAQLNVAADSLANHAAFLHEGHDASRLPLITGSMALLHLQSGTITSRLRPALRRLATAGSSQHYLCKSNHWTSEVFHLIDWSFHGLCLRQWYNNKVFITKFLNNWLPLGHQVARYQPFYPASCPSCGHPDEDRNHFLSCPSRPWLPLLLDRLRSFHATSPTHPLLFEILCTGLCHWNEPDLIPWPSFPSPYARLVQHQSRVGWIHLLCGCFVRAWADLHDQFLTDGAPLTACKSGEQWVSKVVALIWDEVHRQWLRRNEARHGRNASTREAALLDQDTRELDSLYRLRSQVQPRDRLLFHVSAEGHRNSMPSSSALRQWLLTWGPVIRQSALTCQSLNLRHTRPISAYFS